MGRKSYPNIFDYEKSSADLMYNAQKELVGAKALFDIGLYRASASRSYFAVFYCVTACNYLEHVPSKDHEQAVRVFHNDFLKTGIFAVDDFTGFHKRILYVKEARNEGDYDFTVDVTKEEANKQLEEAKYILSCFARNYKDLKESVIVRNAAVVNDYNFDKEDFSKKRWINKGFYFEKKKDNVIAEILSKPFDAYYYAEILSDQDYLLRNKDKSFQDLFLWCNSRLRDWGGGPMDGAIQVHSKGEFVGSVSREGSFFDRLGFSEINMGNGNKVVTDDIPVVVDMSEFFNRRSNSKNRGR